MDKATKPTDYLAIKVWGRQLGSYDYYIDTQQAEAFADNAPVDAIYKGEDRKWRCVSDLDTAHHFHSDYAQALADAQK